MRDTSTDGPLKNLPPPTHAMFSLSEEQQEEVEVLESIYADGFTRDATDPTRLSITLDTNVGAVTLHVRLVPEYPQKAPEVDVTSTSHRIVLHDLLRAVRQEAEGQLGLAMVFSLCVFIEEWVATRTKQTAAERTTSLVLDANEADVTKGPTLIEDKQLAAGTPVTRDTFLVWRERFMRERAQTGVTGTLHGAAVGGKESKVTGRMLFEQNKALAASDAAFVDDGVAVEIDESVFAGLDLEDLDEEDGDGDDVYEDMD